MNIAELSLVKNAKAAGWRRCVRAASCVAVAAQLAWSPVIAAGTVAVPDAAKSPASATKPAPDEILKVMQAELTRATTDLAKSEPSPYYVSYTVNDQDVVLLIIHRVADVVG